jgi:hypothetical protein
MRGWPPAARGDHPGRARRAAIEGFPVDSGRALTVKPSKKGLDQPVMPAARNPQPALPAAERAWIDPEPSGHDLLGDAPVAPVGEQTLTYRPIGSPRCIPDEPHDARQEMKRRFRSVELPVGNAGGVGAELLGDLALEQAKIEAAAAQMVPEGPKRGRIGGWKRFLSSQGDMAKGNAGVFVRIPG